MCGELFSLNFEVDLNDDPGSFGGATTTRKRTDILGSIIMVLIFGAAFGLTVHCINNSEVEIVINGYDYCGNICGKNNLKTDSIPFDCFGKNYKKKKYLESLIGGVRKFCIKVRLIKPLHYSIMEESKFPFYVKLYKFYWWYPAFLGLCSISYIIYVYFMIYYHEEILVKLFTKPEIIIISGNLLALFLLVFGDKRSIDLVNDEFFELSSYLAIIPIVGVIIIIPSLYANHKKVDSIYQLYKVVVEVTNSIESIWILPIVPPIIFAAYVYGMTYCLIYIESFSYPEIIDEETPDKPIIEYIPYPIATTTQALLIYTIFLLYEFLKNLQTLIISGWVAQRYFTKNNDEEFKPITEPLLKHLGSVCCASLILSATFPIRVVVNVLKGIVIMIYEKWLYTCLRSLATETFFFTRNGLIMTAIHGSSFCAGTIRSRKLLHHNVFNASGISTFTDFTFLILKLVNWLLLIVACYVLSKTYNYNSFKKELIYFVSYGILGAFFLDFASSFIEVTIKTIFLCFCEDCVYNNGTSKPYFMSARFAQFVEDANKFVDEDKWNTIADKWSGGPGRLY